jgi:hypothetical protein
MSARHFAASRRASNALTADVATSPTSGVATELSSRSRIINRVEKLPADGVDGASSTRTSPKMTEKIATPTFGPPPSETVSPGGASPAPR